MRLRLPIVVMDDSGEFGNRLVTHLYALAYATELQRPLVNLCFWRYQAFIENSAFWNDPSRRLARRTRSTRARRHDSASCHWCKWPVLRTLHRRFVFDGYWRVDPGVVLIRVTGYIVRFVVRCSCLSWVVRLFYFPESHDLDEHYFRLLVPKHLVGRIRMSRELFGRHSEVLRDYVRIALALRHDSAKACANSGLVATIGVHVRRGDYKVYRGGEWYYPDMEYAGFIRRIQQQMEDDFPEVRILIISNGDTSQLLALIPGAQRIGGDLIEDFCTLGNCDFIVGPPSTFSGMASYCFDRPIIFMENKRDVVLAPVRWMPRWF